MRISDWSSDVCSSDLRRFRLHDRHHDQPPVDLLPPVHPRGILLSDITAIGEADAVQFRRIAFEPQRRPVAEFPASLGDAQRQPVRAPVGIGPLPFIGRASPALAEVRSEVHTYELQTIMRLAYAVYCL